MRYVKGETAACCSEAGDWCSFHHYFCYLAKPAFCEFILATSIKEVSVQNEDQESKEESSSWVHLSWKVACLIVHETPGSVPSTVIRVFAYSTMLKREL